MKALTRPLVACLGVAALLLAACAPAAAPTAKPAVLPTAAPKPAGPIRIGVIGELSGPFAGVVKIMFDTMGWLFEQDGMQVAGHPIQFVYADTEGKVDVFLSKAKRLIEFDKVQLMVWSGHSGIAATAKDWINSSSIPWVTPETGTVKFYPGPNVVRSVATSWHQALPEIGKYMAETYGAKKAITIGLDYAAGRDYVDGIVQKVLPGGNIEVIQQFWTPIGTPDFGPILSQMKTGPDVMITGALWGADSVRFMQQAEEFGIKKKVKIIAFPAAFALDDVGLGPLGKSAEGILNWFDLPPPDYPTPEMSRFVDAFKLKFGTPPAYGWRGLVAYTIVKQAIESLNGNVEDPQALMKATRRPINLPTGPISFDACGNAILKLYLKEIKLVGGQAQSAFIKEFPNASIPCPQPAEWK